MPRPTKEEKTCPKCGHDGGSVVGVYLRYGNKYQRVGWYCGKCQNEWWD